MADKLLPCPFCDNESLVYGYAFVPGLQDARRIQCGKCGTEGPVGEWKSEAAAKWNGRGCDQKAENPKCDLCQKCFEEESNWCCK